jgi:D-sedoheptulose 7-phosphate isomerase
VNAPPAWLQQAMRQRGDVNRQFFADEADRIAHLCREMAGRFRTGGRLLALGARPADRSDARHVAVEFVHPVIVGKRALPALAVTAEGGPVDSHVALLARPQDIVIAFGHDDDTERAVAAARTRGCLTIGCPSAAAAWPFTVPADDPFICQEITETLYHVLWELVHVFHDHQVSEQGDPAEASSAGQAGFLYPFLQRRVHDTDAALADVRRSAVMKSEEIGVLRDRTIERNADTMFAAADALRTMRDAGGVLLALGNGGSATDAIDVVADFCDPPQGWPAYPAIDLTEDSGIITALANDIGVDAIFRRQIIAYAGEHDIVFALSTSGNSTNVIAALDEARRRRLVSIALVGYDGGRIAAEGLADHVIISESQNIPRIQEAQATAYHLLREMVARDSNA